MSFLPTKQTLNPIPSHIVVSDTQFIAPSGRLTGPVEFPAEGEADKSREKASISKDKKKSCKSLKEGKEKDMKRRTVSSSPDNTSSDKLDYPQPQVHPKPQVSAQATSGPESVQQVNPNPIPVQTSYSDQYEVLQPGQDLPRAQPSTSGFISSSLAGAYNYPPEPDTLDIELPQSDTEYSDTPADSDEGEISSDTLEKPEQRT